MLDQYIHFILVYILNTTGMTNLMIALLHFEPFTQSHFSFLIGVKSAASEGLCQCPSLHSHMFCLHSEMVYPCVLTFHKQISALSEFLESFRGTCTS